MPIDWDSKKTFDTFDDAIRYHGLTVEPKPIGRDKKVVVKSRADGYPFIGRTGKGDMRSTREYGQIILAKGERKVIVETETYRLLLDAADELARLKTIVETNAERTKDT